MVTVEKLRQYIAEDAVASIVDGRRTSAGNRLRQVWKHLTFAMRYSKQARLDTWASELPRRF